MSIEAIQQAEVTDHVIRKTYSDVMTALREENRHVIGGAVAIESDMPVRFARAILVLRTERVPMTREQVFASDELPARTLIRAHRKATRRLNAVKKGKR